MTDIQTFLTVSSTFQSAQKLLRASKKFQSIQKNFRVSGNFPERLESFQSVYKLSRLSISYPGALHCPHQHPAHTQVPVLITLWHATVGRGQNTLDSNLR